MKIRKASDRGHLDINWLSARHSFSFGSFFDPEYMGYKSLRVMNNDTIAPGGGFDTHPHNNMEILTFVIDGELEHKDTLGNRSVITPGEIQLMSAGRGIFHSEFNPSDKNKTHLYQIWVEANKRNTEPRYEQYSYEQRKIENGLTLLASPIKKDQVAEIYSDVEVYLGNLKENKKLIMDKSKAYWIQLLSGELEINHESIYPADGVALEVKELSEILAKTNSEFLLFVF